VQINKLLRDFLWHGGKGNQHKFHLVRWEIVKLPLREGGLQIRDPALVNTTLGCKILWKMHSEPSHLISKTLLHKYIPSAKIQNLQNATYRKSTQLWQLCLKGTRIFTQDLYRVPRNGKRTYLWTDRIMGRSSLASNATLNEIRVLPTKETRVSVTSQNGTRTAPGQNGISAMSQIASSNSLKRSKQSSKRQHQYTRLKKTTGAGDPQGVTLQPKATLSFNARKIDHPQQKSGRRYGTLLRSPR
jgi:hypothetical protein